MRHTVYSHCAGTEVVPEAAKNEIARAISSLAVKIGKGAATRLRENILEQLVKAGWSGEFLVSKDSDMTITSTKAGVGLCLQTGNMARMYADLLKLQSLYTDDAISSAVMIVPSYPVAKKLGS